MQASPEMTNRHFLKNACQLGIIILLVQMLSDPAYAFQGPCSTERVMYGLGTIFPSLVAMLLSVALAPISVFLYIKRPTSIGTHAVIAVMLGVWFMIYQYGNVLSQGTCTPKFSKYGTSYDWVVLYGMATMPLSLIVQQFVFRVLSRHAIKTASWGVLAILLIMGLTVMASTTKHTRTYCGTSCWRS